MTSTSRLTDLQLGVVAMLANGFTRKQVAAAHGFSCKAVDFHFERICQKWRISRRMDRIALLTRRAVEAGLVET